MLLTVSILSFIISQLPLGQQCQFADVEILSPSEAPVRAKVDSEPTLSESEVVALSKQYLASSGNEKAELAKQLRQYTGSIELVIQSIISSEEKQWTDKAGIIEADHFTSPSLRDRYKDDLLYFCIPDQYNTKEPFGLLIFMHGGNANVARTAAGWVVNPNYGLLPHIEQAPFITVAPSARCKGMGLRWNQPEVDDYLTAVIRECQYRFNIDRDRVFLGGQSLGGFGAYHWCQRIADKIAGGILCAGSWRAANWQCMIGTPLFIVHGEHDSRPGGRPRYTDVFFARTAYKLLTHAGADVLYAEHQGRHGLATAGESLSKLTEWTCGKKRDPFFPHVVAVTPRGFDSRGDRPAPHHRWITILEIGDGKVEFDSVKFVGPALKWGESPEDWHKQKWIETKDRAKGGIVDALYNGNNIFEVKTENVKKFSLWLHPDMVDFSRPVLLTVNGQRTTHRCEPTLLDALRSFERRKDWGLIYYAEPVVNII